MEGRLIVITGAQAAGKTTIGRELARHLPRAVHVDGDVIHDMVMSGAIDMDVPPPPGAYEQLRLRYRGSLAVAQVYRAAGFDAIVSDNIFEQDLLDVIAMAHENGEVHVVMLTCDAGTVQARENGRAKTGYNEILTPQVLVDAVDRTPRLGLWHDSSTQTIAQTVEQVLSKLDTAIVRR